MTDRHALADALRDFPVEGGRLSESELDEIVSLLRLHGATSADLIELDSKPGRYGGYNGWHYKLRQLRNRRGFSLK